MFELYHISWLVLLLFLVYTFSWLGLLLFFVLFGITVYFLG